MSERWREYMNRGIAEAGGPVPFALSRWQYLFPVFLALRRAVPGGGRVLDVGCGAGIFASLLAHHGYQVTGIDDDPAIVEYARGIADCLRSPVRIERGDAFDLGAYHGRYDLAYSVGVVEHFDADVTVELLREQFRCAASVIVVVPTRQIVRAGGATDERFYSRAQLAALVGRAGCRVSECFVFGDVPTLAARVADRVLPPVLYRRFKQFRTLGMSICCVGQRR